MINNNKKAGGFYNLPTIIHRATHDTEHPFNIQSAKLYEDLKGHGLQLLIMLLLLSNKGDAEKPTDTDWVIVQKEIRERSGIARDSFRNEWDELERKGFIENIGTRTNAKWVIWEDPSQKTSCILPAVIDMYTARSTLTTTKRTNIQEDKDFVQLTKRRNPRKVVAEDLGYGNELI
jgi:hypothetical protein